MALDIPFFGDLCSSLDDIKKENCDPSQQAAMGGEPGSMEELVFHGSNMTHCPVTKTLVSIFRPTGMYYIRMVPDPDRK